LLISRLKEARIDAVELQPGVLRFAGTPDVGWRAAAICIAAGAMVESLRRVWPFVDGTEPAAPVWEITID